MHWLALLLTIVMIHPVWFPLAKNEWHCGILALLGMFGTAVYLAGVKMKAGGK